MDNFLTPLIDSSYSKNSLQPKESEVSGLSTNGDKNLEKPNEVSVSKKESTLRSSLK